MKQGVKGFVAAVAVLMSIPGLSSAGEVRVAVAANFTDAMRDIVPLFEKATGNHVKVSFGSTGKLYAQIEHGAPFEVFLAADGKRPQKAETEGLAVKGTRFTYARGRLVLWSAASHRFRNGIDYLKQARFARLAIANPETAPYGLAARQVMEHLGIWGALQGKLVRGDSIAQTFQFTATANAEAGFVAASQLINWKGGMGTMWYIPESYYTPIEQQALLLKRGEGNAAAKAFLAFLKGDAARRVISGYGYGVAE